MGGIFPVEFSRWKFPGGIFLGGIFLVEFTGHGYIRHDFKKCLRSDAKIYLTH